MAANGIRRLQRFVRYNGVNGANEGERIGQNNWIITAGVADNTISMVTPTKGEANEKRRKTFFFFFFFFFFPKKTRIQSTHREISSNVSAPSHRWPMNLSENENKSPPEGSLRKGGHRRERRSFSATESSSQLQTRQQRNWSTNPQRTTGQRTQSSGSKPIEPSRHFGLTQPTQSMDHHKQPFQSLPPSRKRQKAKKATHSTAAAAAALISFSQWWSANYVSVYNGRSQGQCSDDPVIGFLLHFLRLFCSCLCLLLLLLLLLGHVHRSKRFTCGPLCIYGVYK